MLIQKKTLLKLHSAQRTSDHVYFEYDGYADVPEEVTQDANYRVGYYLHVIDWVDMGSPTELTITAQVGNHMENGLDDEGEREGDEAWDIDLNMTAREGMKARMKAEKETPAVDPDMPQISQVAQVMSQGVCGFENEDGEPCQNVAGHGPMYPHYYPEGGVNG